jgi:hypothetical protein
MAREPRVGSSIQVGVGQLAKQPLHGQPSLPAVVEDFQDRFGTLHSASLPVGKSSNLSPFAVYTALPFADDYGDSAAVGLAAGRQSRMPRRATSECAVGASFVSLSGRIVRRPSGGRLRAASIGRPYPDGVASAVVIDG